MSQENMYHLGFGEANLPAEYRRVALLSGDPERARVIAQQTPGVECLRVLSENRGLNSYLCRRERDGLCFLSSTSGMGAPSLSIVVNELHQIGVRKMIRVGTCGSIQDHVRAGDLVISSAALRNQGAANDIAPPEFPAAADPFVTVALKSAADSVERAVHIGVTASTDTFYEGQERTGGANPNLLRRLRGMIDEYRDLNIINVEMEAATLFVSGLVYGFAAGCVCAVLADRTQSEGVQIEVKDAAVADAIQVAVHAL